MRWAYTFSLRVSRPQHQQHWQFVRCVWFECEWFGAEERIWSCACTNTYWHVYTVHPSFLVVCLERKQRSSRRQLPLWSKSYCCHSRSLERTNSPSSLHPDRQIQPRNSTLANLDNYLRSLQCHRHFRKRRILNDFHLGVIGASYQDRLLVIQLRHHGYYILLPDHQVPSSLSRWTSISTPLTTLD